MTLAARIAELEKLSAPEAWRVMYACSEYGRFYDLESAEIRKKEIEDKANKDTKCTVKKAHIEVCTGWQELGEDGIFEAAQAAMKIIRELRERVEYADQFLVELDGSPSIPNSIRSYLPEVRAAISLDQPTGQSY